MRPLERCRRRWEDNINLILRGCDLGLSGSEQRSVAGCCCECGTEPSGSIRRRRMSLRNERAICFSRRTLLHAVSERATYIYCQNTTRNHQHNTVQAHKTSKNNGTTVIYTGTQSKHHLQKVDNIYFSGF
jgi:hypothetical protein